MMSLQATIKAGQRRYMVMRDGQDTLQMLSILHACNREDSVFVSRWKQLILHGSKRGRFFHIGHRLSVSSGREYSGRPSHRVVLAVMDIKTQECRPSVGELILVVSWMLAGMRYQESAKKRKRHKDKAVRLHMVFPTSIYCFMRPAWARVLYGYFENNKLKVVTTKAHDFNVPNYAEMMDSLVRWPPKIYMEILNRRVSGCYRGG